MTNISISDNLLNSLIDSSRQRCLQAAGGAFLHCYIKILSHVVTLVRCAALSLLIFLLPFWTELWCCNMVAVVIYAMFPLLTVLSSAGWTTYYFEKSKILSSEARGSPGSFACLNAFDWKHNRKRHTWLKKKFTQLAPYPPRSPNKGDRIGEAEPSTCLPGDTSGYSPRLSITADTFWHTTATPSLCYTDTILKKVQKTELV